MPRLPFPAVAVAVALVAAISSAPTPAPAQTARLLKDIVPGLPGSNPSGFTDLFGTTVFGTSASSVSEIWKTDGTTTNTVLVRQLPIAGARAANFTRVGDRVLFTRTFPPTTARTDIWQTDGTATGTVPLATLAGIVDVIAAVAAGDKMIVYGSESFLARLPNALWATDGTPAGTQLLRHFQPTSTTELIGVGDRVVLRARDAATGFELWLTDGTANGTRLIRDVNPGPADGVLDQPVKLRDALYFLGDDGANGADLWRTDGTANGTVLWADLTTPGSSSARLIGAGGDHVIAAVHLGGGVFNVWSFHRTTGQRTLLPVTESPAYGIEFQNGVLFELGPPVDLVFTDGTVAGTRRLSIGQSGTFPRGNVVAGSRLAFVELQPGLWVSDGTGAGTRQVLGVPGMFLPGALALSDSRLYFRARLPNALFEPYVVDLGATSAPIGTGLGVGLRVPELRMTDPVLGARTTVTVHNVVAGATVGLFVGPGLPRPAWFAPGAFSYIDPALAFAIVATVTADRWDTTIPVPPAASLLGLPVVFQAIVLGTGAARGFELSNAVYAHLGR